MYKNFDKQSKAFSLAEIMLVFGIIAIITAITVQAGKNKIDASSNSLFYYSAYTNLQRAIGELMVEVSGLASTPCATVGGTSLCIDISNATITPVGTDYSAGARSACSAKKMRLPSLNELKSMYSDRVALGLSGVYWSDDENKTLNMSSGAVASTAVTDSTVKAHCVVKPKRDCKVMDNICVYVDGYNPTPVGLAPSGYPNYYAGEVAFCNNRSMRVPTLAELSIVNTNRSLDPLLLSSRWYWSSELGTAGNNWCTRIPDDAQMRYGWDISGVARLCVTPELDNLCSGLANTFNTTGTVNCTLDTITGFTKENANFTASNGMRFYALGGDKKLGDADYTIYIDIDGPRSSSELGKDIFRFVVKQDGTVLPYYDVTEPSTTDKSYLSASVWYNDSVDGSVKWATKNVPFLTAYCVKTNTYPAPIGTVCPAVATTLHTTHCASNDCSIVINKPGFKLFSFN